MKQKLKKILLLYLFTGTLFVSCTMEEEVIRNHNYSKDIKIYQKSFDELIKDSKFATSFNKLPKRKTILKSSAQARTVMEEQYGFTITNTPVRVMQVGNLTSYTFHIERDSPNSTYFENLVVQNDSIGNTTAHIIKYTPFMPMMQFAEHNSYSFVGDSEVTSIVYDDNTININGRVITVCRNLYRTMCNGKSDGSCTGSPHIVNGACLNYSPNCIFQQFLNETCSTYDDGENDEVISDDSAIGGDNTSGGSGTVGTDPIYSDPLCPTCPEFSDKDCNITVEQLQQLFPNSTADIRNKLAEMINEVANDFGIDTKNEICHFLAQTGAETGGFITLNATEGLNYTSANRLLIVYPSKFSLTDPSLANPNNYLNNPQALANYVYCCKYGNGNEASGDGWRYRGRGIVQLTWKSNYDAYVNFLNNIGLGWSYSNPDIIESDYRHSIVSGMWFFKQNVLDKMEINDATTSNSVTKKVNRYAPKDTKIIRQNYLNSAKNIINCQ